MPHAIASDGTRILLGDPWRGRALARALAGARPLVTLLARPARARCQRCGGAPSRAPRRQPGHRPERSTASALRHGAARGRRGQRHGRGGRARGRGGRHLDGRDDRTARRAPTHRARARARAHGDDRGSAPHAPARPAHPAHLRGPADGEPGAGIEAPGQSARACLGAAPHAGAVPRVGARGAGGPTRRPHLLRPPVGGHDPLDGLPVAPCALPGRRGDGGPGRAHPAAQLRAARAVVAERPSRGATVGGPRHPAARAGRGEPGRALRLGSPGVASGPCCEGLTSSAYRW